MKKNWKKIILVAAISVTLAAIAAMTAAALKYIQMRDAGTELKAPEFVLTPAKDIRLGSRVSADAILVCPWHRWPVKTTISPGNGSQAAGNPSIRLSGIGWGSWKWKISCGIQPYLNGSIGAGKAVIELSSPAPSDKQKSLEAAIPSFESAQLDTGNSQDLAVAGKMTKEIGRSKAILILSGIALLILVVMYVWFSRKRRDQVRIEIPAWTIALMEFEKLRRELKEHRLTADICIVRLTDTIRNYLEKRFSLHAPKQTTAEFMEELKRDSSPLKTDDKEFLKDFLMAADLVKFAKLPADETVIDNAITKAELLVNTTKPFEEAAGRQPPAKTDNIKRNQQF